VSATGVSTMPVTAATDLLLLGVHERTIMSVLGWSTTAIASRYTHVNPQWPGQPPRRPPVVQQRRINRTQLRPHLRPQPKNAGAQLAAGPAFGLVRLAVAAGFEPAEGCPSRAFEARSLGRSDTPPPERLPTWFGCANLNPTHGFVIVRYRPVPGGVQTCSDHLHEAQLIT
jgi:hypothetical protein